MNCQEKREGQWSPITGKLPNNCFHPCIRGQCGARWRIAKWFVKLEPFIVIMWCKKTTIAIIAGSTGHCEWN